MNENDTCAIMHWRDVVDRVENFLTSSLITTQNSAVVSHTVRAHVASPTNFGDSETQTPWDWNVADPLEIEMLPFDGE